MKIALVDDESLQLDYLIQTLKTIESELNLSFDTLTYQSGEAFLFALPDYPDLSIVFLDIEMGGINGMEVAQKIRETHQEVAIVFITAYAEYAIEGYKVEALDYLLKPVTQDNIQRIIERYLTYKPVEEQFVILTIDHKPIRIPMDSIYYVESFERQLIVYLTDDTLEAPLTLTEFIELVDDRFVQCHRSYYVNLDHIERLLSTEIELDNGERVPLARRRAKEVQTAFINHYHQQVFYDG